MDRPAEGADVDERGPRVRTGPRSMFSAVFGLSAPLAVCGIPGHTDSPARIAAEVAVLAVVVGMVGFGSSAPVGLLVAVGSLLSLNGFAEGAYGQLGWYPDVDLPAAAVLGAAWAVAFTLAAGRRPARRQPASERRIPGP